MERIGSGMKKVQPYDFFPIDSPIEKKSFDVIKIEEGFSGTIKVRLTVITPMIEVNEAERNSKAKRGFTIPGSSIRGALRSAAEVLWNGTIGVFKLDEKDIKFLKDEWKMSNCTISSHCPVSHLFGFVAAEKGKTKNEDFEGNIPWALGSRLKFSQATAIESTYNGAYIQMEQLRPPKKNPPLQKSNNGKKYFLGRKIYLAGRLENVDKKMKIVGSYKKNRCFNERDFFNPNARLKGRVNQEFAIFPGSQYIFFIEFKHLTKEELADVIRLLELEEGYYHAIGKGKPLGLGRVRFEVEGIKYKDKNYFLNLEFRNEYDATIKYKLLEGTKNKYENNFKKYYDLLDMNKFDGKKSYGSGNEKVYRYSEIKEKVKAEKEFVKKMYNQRKR
jgi:CRISPR/Cas system CSM-associated protein Csm3 (group 7 of RAMP superfamily)